MAYFKDSDRLSWASDGQRVTVPLFDGKGSAWQGIVTIAAGDHAYVEQINGSRAGWFDVTDLFPGIPDEELNRVNGNVA